MEFLLLFAGQEFENFKEAEFLSLLDISQIKFNKSCLQNHDWNNNFLIISLESYDDVRNLINRSILIKCAYRVWTVGTSIESICEKISSFPDEFTNKMNEERLTYRLNIEAIHKKYSFDEKLKLIEMVLESHKQLPRNDLNLNNPDVELGLILNYEYDKVKGKVSQTDPTFICYGELVCYSQRLKITAKYKMSNRKFIGNTSMDVKLSFLMTNLGRVLPNQLILDPFVGSGSILIAAAHNGAKVFGTDIDYKVIFGLGKSTRADKIWRAEDECLRLNFQQYNLETNYMDVFVGDSSRLDRILQPSFQFDSILTDPPYGIRERGRKLMAVENRPYMNDNSVPHFPQKESYEISSVYDDLLSLSAKRIKIGGYLIMWIPLVRGLYKGDISLPKHCCMKMIHNCEQILNERTSRRLLAYRKMADPNINNGQVSSGLVNTTEYLRNCHFNSNSN